MRLLLYDGPLVAGRCNRRRRDAARLGLSGLRGNKLRCRVHSESLANLLIPLRLYSTLFSECPLKSLRGLADFDSTIRRFESSRPSQAVRQLEIVISKIL